MFAVHVYERVRITDLGSIVNDLGLINDLSFVVSLKKSLVTLEIISCSVKLRSSLIAEYKRISIHFFF